MCFDLTSLLSLCVILSQVRNPNIQCVLVAVSQAE